MSKTRWLVVGGPLDGEKGTTEELREKCPTLYEDYIQFNCSGGVNRSGWALRRAAREGRVVPPSAIWVHRSLFEGFWNDGPTSPTAVTTPEPNPAPGRRVRRGRAGETPAGG